MFQSAVCGVYSDRTGFSKGIKFNCNASEVDALRRTDLTDFTNFISYCIRRLFKKELQNFESSHKFIEKRHRDGFGVVLKKTHQTFLMKLKLVVMASTDNPSDTPL